MPAGVLQYGTGGVQATEEALGNFHGAAMQGLSFCCTPIELLSNDGSDTIIGRASGFFWRYDGRPYLVTNWHVLSGRNPFAGNILSENGYIPRRLSFYGYRINVQLGLIRFVREKWTLDLSERLLERLASPPIVRGSIVDIWALPIDPAAVFGKDATRVGFANADSLTCFVNEWRSQRIVTHAGDDCFILGYPLANYGGLMPPVWKRGSIASETNIGVDGRPVFLVDAAVTASMSGSPIIRKVTTLTADNRDIGALQEFSQTELIGIYAGRLQNREMTATNLGYGWYRTLIEPVVQLCTSIAYQ